MGSWRTVSWAGCSVQLYLAEHGEEAVVLFLHHSVIKTQAELLEQVGLLGLANCTLVAPCACSQSPVGRWSDNGEYMTSWRPEVVWNVFLEVLKEAVSNLHNVPPIHVVGHGAGGVCALQLCDKQGPNLTSVAALAPESGPAWTRACEFLRRQRGRIARLRHTSIRLYVGEVDAPADDPGKGKGKGQLRRLIGHAGTAELMDTFCSEFSRPSGLHPGLHKEEESIALNPVGRFKILRLRPTVLGTLPAEKSRLCLSMRGRSGGPFKSLLASSHAEAPIAWALAQTSHMDCRLRVDRQLTVDLLVFCTPADLGLRLLESGPGRWEIHGVEGGSAAREQQSLCESLGELQQSLQVGDVVESISGSPPSKAVVSKLTAASELTKVRLRRPVSLLRSLASSPAGLDEVPEIDVTLVGDRDEALQRERCALRDAELESRTWHFERVKAMSLHECRLHSTQAISNGDCSTAVIRGCLRSVLVEKGGRLTDKWDVMTVPLAAGGDRDTLLASIQSEGYLTVSKNIRGFHLPVGSQVVADAMRPGIWKSRRDGESHMVEGQRMNRHWELRVQRHHQLHGTRVSCSHGDQEFKGRLSKSGMWVVWDADESGLVDRWDWQGPANATGIEPAEVELDCARWVLESKKPSYPQGSLDFVVVRVLNVSGELQRRRAPAVARAAPQALSGETQVGKVVTARSPQSRRWMYGFGLAVAICLMLAVRQSVIARRGRGGGKI
mmetsp:Transcript_64303/g.172133  ORF Transcript_64303/g.172133 Transcript_64303/m.172133 type:complete len:725 (+) Transcript_64303:53-2227(+)